MQYFLIFAYYVNFDSNIRPTLGGALRSASLPIAIDNLGLACR